MRRTLLTESTKQEIDAHILKATFRSSKPTRRIVRELFTERRGRGPHRRALSIL
ncbi:MAG: hypothetical protein WCB68_24220 [Pyrinomonadaceae bacterium]